MSDDDVEYEFVKGTGWVPKLKQEAPKAEPGFFALDLGYSLFEDIRARGERIDAFVGRERDHERGMDRYERERDFNSFCRDVRVVHDVLDYRMATATYRSQHRRTRERDGRYRDYPAQEYAVRFEDVGMDSRVRAFRQLYDIVHPTRLGCERCGTDWCLERIPYHQDRMRCMNCGRTYHT